MSRGVAMEHAVLHRAERLRPINLARLGVKRVDRLGVPDDELARAAGPLALFVRPVSMIGRAVADVLGLQRGPQHIAGHLVERGDELALAGAGEADQLVPVDERVGGVAPGRRLRAVLGKFFDHSGLPDLASRQNRSPSAPSV